MIKGTPYIFLPPFLVIVIVIEVAMEHVRRAQVMRQLLRRFQEGRNGLIHRQGLDEINEIVTEYQSLGPITPFLVK